MSQFLPNDVSAAVIERQLARYREMSPAEKLALADGMWDLAWEATTLGVRMREPSLDEATVAVRAREILRNARD